MFETVDAEFGTMALCEFDQGPRRPTQQQSKINAHPASEICAIHLADHFQAMSYLMGWNTLDPLQQVSKDTMEGQRQGRFREMPVELALCLVGVSGIAGIQVMLLSAPSPEIPRLTAEALLRALGLEHDEAAKIALIPIDLPALPANGIIDCTMRLSESPEER